MGLVLLRRVPIANVAPATGFTVFTDQYDTTARRPYRDAYQAANNTGANAAFELTLGALVPGASFCVSGTQRQVKYAGSGKVSTHDVPNAPACASSLSRLTLTTAHCTTLYSNDATLTATWSGGVGPLRVRIALLAAGIDAAATYYDEQPLPEGTQTITFPQDQAITVMEGPRRDRLVTYPPAGLGPGRYRVEVLEETGGIVAQELTVFPSHDPQGVNAYQVPSTGASAFQTFGTAPFVVAARFANIANDAHGGLAELYSDPLPAGKIFTAYAVRGLSESQAQVSISVYDAFTGVVSSGTTLVDIPKEVSTVSLLDVLPPVTYLLPLGSAAASVGVITTAYGNGQGGVSVVAGDAPTPRLELANLIYFHPARPAQATGGVVVEVHSFANRTAAAVAFALRNAAGTVLATNTTGRFGSLAAGTYSVRATLGDALLDVPVVLAARYGLKWRLRFADVRVNKPCRLELWVRGYTGPVLELHGQAEPVTLETEGFAGGNTQRDLPAVIGSSATLRLRTAPGALAELLVDDRAGRADVFYNEALVFTGYLQPDIYTESAVGTSVDVELTATDGLAALRDVDFAGHDGQQLRHRWPVLHTLLHALSRTDLALPLALFTNRRALEMSSDEQPETDLRTDRLGYLDGDKPLDLRAVVDALAEQQGGTLVQKNGRWALISALEAAAEAPGRTYDAAGDHADTEVASAPSCRLTPERVAKLDTGAAHPLYWSKAGQHRQRRAGWRYLTATGDATYATNAFQQGTYFSDPAAWDDSGTALLPTSGWEAGERSPLPASAFPLQLVEAGGDSQELATNWPVNTSPTDSRYLESELAPVAAGLEGVPVLITVVAKWLSGIDPNAGAFKLATARLWVELVGVAESGSILLQTVGAALDIPPAASFTAGFTTATARLVLPLPPGVGSVRVRVHPYTYENPQRARDYAGGTDPRAGRLLLRTVELQPQPQGATWKAADAYYASGSGGSVRPAGLEVFHVDAPARAGLFGGVAHAFRRSVTRGAADSPATQWARADDLKPAPLLASAVLDTLALRANPSQVLTGPVHHTRRPPEILDSIDPPYDAPGRRFAVGARSWAMKSGTTDVSLVEIGEGEHLVLPTLPPRVRLLHGLIGGRVRVRLTHRGGIRAVHP